MHDHIERLLWGRYLPENYGLGRILAGPVHLDVRGAVELEVDPRREPKSYECMSAASEVKELLESHAIPSEIWEGSDETGVWTDHYYNVLEDDTILDATPPHPLFGSNHGRRNQVVSRQLSTLDDSRLDLSTGRPVRFYSHDGQGYVTVLGVNGDFHNDWGVWYHVTRLRGTEPNVWYDLSFFVDPSMPRYSGRMRKEEFVKRGLLEEKYTKVYPNGHRVVSSPSPDLLAITQQDWPIIQALYRNTQDAISKDSRRRFSTT